MDVNLVKIDRMAGLTFQNVIRLHEDSVLLFDNESFPSSFFLSVLALEELGKYYMLDHFLFHSRVDGRMGEKWDRIWLEDIFNHKRKQMTFASAYRFELPEEYLNIIYDGQLEIEKQNAIYVGLPKVNRKMDLHGKIVNPLKFSKSKVKKHITLLNDCLLEQCLIVVKEVGCLDSYYAEGIINIDLVNWIESVWDHKSKKTLKRINQLKKIV